MKYFVKNYFQLISVSIIKCVLGTIQLLQSFSMDKGIYILYIAFKKYNIPTIKNVSN